MDCFLAPRWKSAMKAASLCGRPLMHLISGTLHGMKPRWEQQWQSVHVLILFLQVVKLSGFRGTHLRISADFQALPSPELKSSTRRTLKLWSLCCPGRIGRLPTGPGSCSPRSKPMGGKSMSHLPMCLADSHRKPSPFSVVKPMWNQCETNG